MELANLKPALDSGGSAGRQSKLSNVNSDERDDEPGEVTDAEKTIEVKQGCLKRCAVKFAPKNQPSKKPLGYEQNPNLRVKNTIKHLLNGSFFLTLMTLVTFFALIGVSISVLGLLFFRNLNSKQLLFLCRTIFDFQQPRKRTTYTSTPL